ncbi:MAG: hypothetical protein MJA29_11010 [Candidatus Omnitrophica bacterium]|nr:hypothetical protein [Candidatus Omnitrophota bacterium]
MKKKILLVVLIVLAVVVWMPAVKRRMSGRGASGKEPGRQPGDGEGVSVSAGHPVRHKRERSAFRTWGSNPFLWQRSAKKGAPAVSLSGIIWDEEKAYAIINDIIVHEGDRVGDRKVLRIERKKVVLSEGMELKL